MKRKQKHIILSWILLLCFIAGQYTIYAHQHKTKVPSVFSVKAHKHHSAVKEKCDLCDAMHHNYMDICMKVYLPAPTAVKHFYPSSNDHIISFGLVLSRGRSPPLS